MIRLATQEDSKDILSILNDDDIRALVSDDLTPPVDSLQVSENVFLICGDFDGVFLIVPRNSTTVEIHAAFKTDKRGKVVIDGLKEVFTWLTDNTSCLKVVAEIPRFNFRAKAAAIKVGFRLNGINTKSFLKDGQLIDQYIYGKELTCHH
jgi:hypothetical protein